MATKRRIEVPVEARVSERKVGDLTPVEAFHTAGYGCVAGKSTPMGPTMTYKFNGQDLRLEFDVLVRTANAFAGFPYTADRIVSEQTQREYGKDFIAYELEILPKDVQKGIFEAMKVDWGLTAIVQQMIRKG